MLNRMLTRMLIPGRKGKLLLCKLITFALLSPVLWARDYLVYFGTFTDASSRGIYVARLDVHSGKLSTPELAAAVESPNYLAISPDGRYLFAATRDGNHPGSVASFAIDPVTGCLRDLEIRPSGGDGPCYVSDDARDHCLLAANYGSGSVKSFHLNSDGTFTDATVIQHHGSSVNRARQAGPHTHCFVPAPKGRFGFACDLGLDKVMVYRINPANAALTPNDPPFTPIAPGSGPRHLAFSPDGKTACVLSEMACTATCLTGTPGAAYWRNASRSHSCRVDSTETPSPRRRFNTGRTGGLSMPQFAATTAFRSWQ
jgi:6-phosphogluconolactonase